MKENIDDVAVLTSEMARTISEKYLRNLYRVSLEGDYTRRDVERDMDKANITAELCLELMNTLIIRRYDYLLNSAINQQRTNDLKKISHYAGIPVEDLEGFLRSRDDEIFGMKIKTDNKLPPNSIRFDHPNGNSEGFKL